MANEFLTSSQEFVAGVYRLGALLAQSASGAVYETEFGDEARPAMIKILGRDTTDSERVLARWRDAMELAHPNLLRIYAVGSSVLRDVPVVYVVTERADESLAGVLAERTLSESETREMLSPALAALSYLHKKGYAHASLKPSNILAAGDQLKLSADSVNEDPDGRGAVEDIGALGRVIVQALTQEIPSIKEDSGPYILRESSDRFTEIVRHCLDPEADKRWTVDQVEARLNAPAVARVPEPLEQQLRELVTEAEDREGDGQARRIPKWIFAGLAALVLIVAGAAILRRNSPPDAVASSPVKSREAPPILPQTSDAPKVANVPPPAKVHPITPEVRGTRGKGWSVIVAAYGAPAPAEKRKADMARRWPAFNLSVLPQRAGKTYYLVVLGQNLSEDEAEALRKRAVAMGLPRDTYIKKFP